MDNQNTLDKCDYTGPVLFVLILVLMDNQNTYKDMKATSLIIVLILVLMDNQNTIMCRIPSIRLNVS